jgi:uncharacterized integral membrane protein
MKQVKNIIIILILTLVVILIVQNFQMLTTPVEFKVDLVFYSFQSSKLPLSLVALGAFLIGVIAAGFQGIMDRVGLKRDIRSLRKELAEKEKELNSLRNLPVTVGDVVAGNQLVNQ